MAWVTVPGSNNLWQYDNAATISDTYPDSAMVQTQLFQVVLEHTQHLEQVRLQKFILKQE